MRWEGGQIEFVAVFQQLQVCIAIGIDQHEAGDGPSCVVADDEEVEVGWHAGLALSAILNEGHGREMLRPASQPAIALARKSWSQMSPTCEVTDETARSIPTTSWRWHRLK